MQTSVLEAVAGKIDTPMLEAYLDAASTQIRCVSVTADACRFELICVFGTSQAERWGWTPAVRRVREQYRCAIRVHRAQQRRFWRQKWIASSVSAWRAMVGLFAQVTTLASTEASAYILCRAT